MSDYIDVVRNKPSYCGRRVNPLENVKMIGISLCCLTEIRGISMNSSYCLLT